MLKMKTGDTATLCKITNRGPKPQAHLTPADPAAQIIKVPPLNVFARTSAV